MAHKSNSKEKSKERLLIFVSVLEVVMFSFISYLLIWAEKNYLWEVYSSLKKLIVLRILGVFSYILIAGNIFAILLILLFLMGELIGKGKENE